MPLFIMPIKLHMSFGFENRTGRVKGKQLHFGRGSLSHATDCTPRLEKWHSSEKSHPRGRGRLRALGTDTGMSDFNWKAALKGQTECPEISETTGRRMIGNMRDLIQPPLG